MREGVAPQNNPGVRIMGEGAFNAQARVFPLRQKAVSRWL